MHTRVAKDAELIRRARLDVGLSQAELAQAAGTSQTALWAIESGSRRASAALTRRLLDRAEMRPSIAVAVYAEQLTQLAAEHGLHDLRVFGSVSRGDDTAQSDIDLLASRDPRVPAMRILAFPVAASELLGYPVDLVLDDSVGAAVSAAVGSAVPV